MFFLNTYILICLLRGLMRALEINKEVFIYQFHPVKDILYLYIFNTKMTIIHINE